MYLALAHKIVLLHSTLTLGRSYFINFSDEKMIFREMHNLLKATLLENDKLMSCCRHFMPKIKALCYS